MYILAFLLNLFISPAFAQNVTCTTRPAGDVSNACATTAFVANISRNYIDPGITGSNFTDVTQFGGKLLIATLPNNNAIVGAIVQNGSNGWSSPTGITGYAKLISAGNTAFGSFFRCDQWSTGTCVGGEDDSNNQIGAPNGTFPPNTAFGTSSYESIARQIVSIGAYTAKAGLYFNSTVSGGGYGFVAGIYMNPLAVSSYGVFIDADSTHGPAIASLFKTTGRVNTANIFLQMTSVADPTARFLSAADYNGNGLFYIDGAGNVNTVAQYKVNGLQISASNLSNGVTGSGAIVLATSAVLTTPNLGTPSMINLANATNIPASQLSGALPAGATINNSNWSGTALAASNVATGTSGANIPLLNGINTWSGEQTVNISQNSVLSTWIINTNAGGSAQARFLARSVSGDVSFAAAVGFSNLTSTINGTFYFDSIGTSGAFTLRTGSGPTAALNISSAQVVSLPAIATGTPAASLCIDASNNIIKKTTAGSCI